MKNFRISLLSALTALAVAGCSWGGPHGTPEEKDFFRTAASHLDRDGMEYAVFSGPHLQDIFDRVRQDMETVIWNSKVPHPEKLTRQRQLTFVRMLWQLCGFERLQAAGFSTKTLSRNPYGDNYKHSKFFLALPPDDPGFLNTFFAGNELAVIDSLGELPQETIAASAGILDPDAVLQALKSAGDWGEDNALTLADNLPLEELRSLKGEWHFAVLDKEFRLVRLILPASSEAQAALVRKLLPGVEVFPEKNRMVIYSSAAARKKFQRTGLKMRDRGDFAMLTSCMPEYGFAYAFESKNLFGGEQNMDGFAAGTKTSDGILFLTNDDSGVLKSLIETGLFFGDWGGESEKTETTPAVSPQPSATDDTAALKLLAANRDNWSGEPGFTGLLASFQGKLPARMAQNSDAAPGPDNCVLIYFGKSSTATHPLALLRPAQNDTQFKVLYNDGKIETYQLANANSCRRIISFLHTVHHWEETDFQRLTALADKFDQKKIK